ncbi:signal peptidase [Microterricola gilva]|uniref:Signal peptidase I n=1 Tax=Microterricola gilva TaxID=393267 RepID=A0A4Q8AQT9_9MICO|nr:signal peptidase I [Microterricola gilva]RZU67074.1 signal peptidase [Microterricola gilva]
MSETRESPTAGGVGAENSPEDGSADTSAAVKRFSRVPRWLRVVATVLTWIVIVASLAAITALVVVPRIAGASPYTILTGSMIPDMPPGTIVVVKPLPFDQIRQGDVITYQIESGKPMVVTHRVVGVDVVDGKTRLVTQGDANDAPDAESVREVQVKGVVWYHVPFIGFATTLIDDTSKGIAVRVLGGLLIAYALYVGASLLFKRKKVTR